MSTPSAKDLLEQADQLIRRSRATGADLPVLTELISDAPAYSNPSPTDIIPDLTEFVGERAGDVPKALSPSAGARAVPGQASGATYTREQFDAAIHAKLEQVQHSVYSQVMQQLELHATGEMKRRLREALEPALTQVALDIAAQVSEETSIQVQSIVSSAVENEVARLREQIESKRRDR